MRVVHVAKSDDEHSIRDLNVSVALSGDQAETHLTGDNAKVLTTDAQKNAVYALAAEHGVSSPEPSRCCWPGTSWRRALTSRTPASPSTSTHGPASPGTSRHSFLRLGQETRTALVHADADGTGSVISGLKDLVVLNSTGSEFHGFFKDPYTTLPKPPTGSWPQRSTPAGSMRRRPSNGMNRTPARGPRC